jgi:hypothetical protein
MNTEQDYYILEVNNVDDDILEWCYTTFGTEGPRRDSNVRWFKVNKTFYFSNEQDLTWFRLRWP